MYYKHTMIVNYASSVINELEALLTDHARVVIYDHHVFIVQAIDVKPMSNDLMAMLPFSVHIPQSPWP